MHHAWPRGFWRAYKLHRVQGVQSSISGSTVASYVGMQQKQLTCADIRLDTLYMLLCALFCALPTTPTALSGVPAGLSLGEGCHADQGLFATQAEGCWLVLRCVEWGNSSSLLLKISFALT